MFMTNDEIIRKFLVLLDQSGFPEAKKTYWLEKMAGENFTAEDEKNFTRDLQAHLNHLDEAISLNEADTAKKHAEIGTLQAAALPTLRKLAQEAPAFLDSETATYKKELLDAEKQMMTDVEGVRGKKEDSQIEAIRKMLKK